MSTDINRQRIQTDGKYKEVELTVKMKYLNASEIEKVRTVVKEANEKIRLLIKQKTEK